MARSSSKVGMALSCAALGCTGGSEPLLHGEARSSVVYGDDDREEQDAYPVGSPIHTWARASAMQIDRSRVQSAQATELVLGHDGTFAERMRASGRPLCPEEPFQEQPILDGVCSAFLVAPDLVVTAGHCIIAPDRCPDVAFVFGAGYDEKGRDPGHVAIADVYPCRDVPKVVAQGVHGDYAVVRLDRPVIGRAPLPLRRAGMVDDNEQLVLIGNPLGLPTKIAAHGKIVDNAPEHFFRATTDSYAGSSGSAVIGAQSGLVEGILVRGEKDFVKQGECWVSRACPFDAARCRGEDVSRTSEFVAHVP